MSKTITQPRTLEPFAWLATFVVSLFGLAYVTPPLSASIVLCCTLSIALTLISASKGNLHENKYLPWLGALLSASIGWLAVLLLPVGGQDVGIVERVIVVMSIAVILMPALLVIEMLTSVVFVTAIAKVQGKSNLGRELQVVSLVDRKFGGLLGSINR